VSAVQARQGHGVFPPNSCSRGDGRFRLASGALIEQRQTAGFARREAERGAAELGGRRTRAPNVRSLIGRYVAQWPSSVCAADFLAVPVP
jgi:hypothetical protein